MSVREMLIEAMMCCGHDMCTARGQADRAVRKFYASGKQKQVLGIMGAHGECLDAVTLERKQQDKKGKDKMIRFETKTTAAGLTQTSGGLCLLDNTGGNAEKALGLEPNSRYLVTMVRIPEGYRRATEADRTRAKPHGAMLLRDTQFCDSDNMAGWAPPGSCTYIVPEEAEKAQVKVIVAGKEKMIDHGTALELGLV